MTDEAAFLRAMRLDPDDLAIPLVYADWLDERQDSHAAVVRAWVALAGLSYREEAVPEVEAALARYWEALGRVDPKWVERVGRARPWVSQILAVTLVRAHLRVRHGRREDRQQVGFESWPWDDEWHMYYWRQPPSHKKTSWRGRSWLWVHKVTGQIRGEFHV
jgi:uncharacterized protein (TIGR02996 family)